MIETHGQIAIAGPYIRKHDPDDWPHAEFIVWRDSLFGDPWPARWGPIATPSGDQWGWASVQAWKANWQRLGKCKSHLLYDNDNNAAVQLFDGGDVRLFANVPEVCFR